MVGHEFVIFNESLSSLLRNFPLGCEILLVAHQYDVDLLVRVVANFEEPVVEVLERFLTGDVEYEDGSYRAFVVGARDGLEGLLACGVPDLQLDGLVSNQVHLGAKLDSQGRLMLAPEPVLE